MLEILVGESSGQHKSVLLQAASLARIWDAELESLGTKTKTKPLLLRVNALN